MESFLFCLVLHSAFVPYSPDLFSPFLLSVPDLSVVVPFPAALSAAVLSAPVLSFPDPSFPVLFHGKYLLKFIVVLNLATVLRCFIQKIVKVRFTNVL